MRLSRLTTLLTLFRVGCGLCALDLETVFSFLPKTEYRVVIDKLETIASLRGELREIDKLNRELAVQASRSATLMAALLTPSSLADTSMAALRFLENIHSQGSRAIDAARLSDLRRLAWETARMVSARRIALSETDKYRSALVLEADIEVEGQALTGALERYLSALSVAELVALEAIFSQAISDHPSCPQAAFQALRSAALKLDEIGLRAWVSLSAGASPFAIAAAKAVDISDDPAFSQAFDFFARMMETTCLTSVYPASQAALWYIDKGKERPGPQALLSYNSFFVDAAALGADVIEAALVNDEALANAFWSLLSLTWVAYIRSPAAFCDEIGLDEAALKAVFAKAWLMFPEAGNRVLPSLDFEAIRLVEAASDALREDKDSVRALTAVLALRASPAASFALGSGERYQKAARAAVDSLSAWLSAALEAAALTLSERYPHAKILLSFGGIGENNAVSDIMLIGEIEYEDGLSAPLASSELEELVNPLLAAKLSVPKLAASWRLSFTLPVFLNGGLVDAETLALIMNGRASPPDSFYGLSERLASLWGVPEAFVRGLAKTDRFILLFDISRLLGHDFMLPAYDAGAW